jgi:hypothetical protein
MLAQFIDRLFQQTGHLPGHFFQAQDSEDRIASGQIV